MRKVREKWFKWGIRWGDKRSRWVTRAIKERNKEIEFDRTTEECRKC